MDRGCPKSRSLVPPFLSNEKASAVRTRCYISYDPCPHPICSQRREGRLRDYCCGRLPRDSQLPLSLGPDHSWTPDTFRPILHVEKQLLCSEDSLALRDDREEGPPAQVRKNPTTLQDTQNPYIRRVGRRRRFSDTFRLQYQVDDSISAPRDPVLRSGRSGSSPRSADNYPLLSY